MKKLLFLILLAGFTVTNTAVNAQLRKIPSKVTAGFNAKYPGASKVEWRDRVTSVQANFEIHGTRCEASFDRKGHWKRTEMMMAENTLPLAIKDGWKKSKYRSWKIKSAHVVFYAGGKTHYYIVAARNDLRKKELVFNMRGQLLSDNMTI
jgi:hypothetical protein